jgi:uncharacterized membrane protein
MGSSVRLNEFLLSEDHTGFVQPSILVDMIYKSTFWILVFLVGFVAGFMLWPYFTRVNLPEANISPVGAETFRARVIEIIEEGETGIGDVVQRYQVAHIELLEGEHQGISMAMDYGRKQILPNSIYLQPGDTILVTIGTHTDGFLTVFFVDFVRTNVLLWLTVIFVTVILLMSRWKGLRSLLSMAFSLIVIIRYIIPHILAGEDPLQVSIIGSVILLGVTLYLTYGWNLKTHAAVVSMIVVLLITGTVAGLAVLATRLSGAGSENALFLIQTLNTQINLRGLLLGGMIIGALGVLDDLVTTQASAVFELHHANVSLGFRALFHSAMRIGQDHVAATVNTLVLAYAGASLPMLLLFSLARGNYGNLVNFQFVAEEIVRTLVGSLGLVLAVPLTTVIAILFALRADSYTERDQQESIRKSELSKPDEIVTHVGHRH